MADIKAITNKPTKTPQCPYCGLVPTSEHPDYTCPRISAAHWDDSGGGVDFLDPERWAIVKATLLKPNA